MYFGMKFLWILAVLGINEVFSFTNFIIPKVNIRKRNLFDFDTSSEFRVMVPRHSKRIVLELYDNFPLFGQNVEMATPSFPSLDEWPYGSLYDLAARSFGHNTPASYQPYSQQMSTLQKQIIKPYKVEMARHMPHIILNSTEILPEHRGETEENKKVNVQKESTEAAEPSFRVNTVASSQNVRGNINSINAFIPLMTKRFYNQHVSNVPGHNLETEYLSRFFVKPNKIASHGTKIRCNKTKKSTNYNSESDNPIYRSNEKGTDNNESLEDEKEA